MNDILIHCAVIMIAVCVTAPCDMCCYWSCAGQ